MKKTIKYGVFLIIFLISFFAFKGIAYAEVCSLYRNKQACAAERDEYCVWSPACGNEISFGDEKCCISSMEPDAYTKPCEDVWAKQTCNERSGECVWIKDSKECISKKEYDNRVKEEWGDIIEKEEHTFTCADIQYLTKAWTFIRIVAPFLVILFGSLDFFKAMAASDEKKMKESRGKFVKRLIAFFLLIFLPFMIQFIFTSIGTYGSQNMCMIKCIVTNNTSAKGCD